MQRILLGWTMVCWLAFAAGCTLCSSSYDYCSPTFTGDGCSGGSCDPRLRSGSILAPADGAAMPGQLSGGPMITQEMEPGQIISSGDEVIEEGAPVLKGAPGPTPAKAPQTTSRPQARR